MDKKVVRHKTLSPPSILRRFAALNYDFLLLMAISIAYGLLYIGLSKLLLASGEDRATGILFQSGWLLTLFGFFCYFWKKGGQTTGMRAWRLQIINSTGNTPTTTQCITRFLAAIIGWLLFFTCFFDKEKRMLHEKISYTQLIVLENPKK